MFNRLEYVVAFLTFVCLARCNRRLVSVENHDEAGYPGESVKGLTDLEVALLRGANYAPSLSENLGYYVYYKPGGYIRAEKDFDSVMFHTDVKEWGNGVKSGYIGNQIVVLMPGSNSGHGWIRISNPGNPHLLEKRIVYVLAEDMGIDDTEIGNP